MTDPYNSASVAPAKPIRLAVPPAERSAAEAAPAAELSRIDELQVSERWKMKFRAIHLAGGPALPLLRTLSYGERCLVFINFRASLFGVFYFLFAGLWRTAVLMLGSYFVIVSLLLLIGAAEASRYFVICVQVWLAMRANSLQYRRLVLDEEKWV